MKTPSLKLSSVSMTFQQIQGNNTPKLCLSFSLLSSSVFWLFFLVSYLFPFFSCLWECLGNNISPTPFPSLFPCSELLSSS